MRIDATIYMDVNKAIKVSKEFDGYEIKQDELTLIVTEEQLEDIVLDGEELLYKGEKNYDELKMENDELKSKNEELQQIIEEQDEQFKELTEIAETKGVAL